MVRSRDLSGIVRIKCYFYIVLECHRKKLFFSNRYSVPANLRPAVYSYGFREVGGVREWDIMWNRYVSATTAQEKSYILSALADSKDIWLIQRYFLIEKYSHSLNLNNIPTELFKCKFHLVKPNFALIDFTTEVIPHQRDLPVFWLS